MLIAPSLRTGLIATLGSWDLPRRLSTGLEWASVHPGARGPLRKLGQKLKRGSQIEPYRLSHSFNGLLFTILIHFRSNKAHRKQFGGPFLVLVYNFLKKLVWNPITLASGCYVRQLGQNLVFKGKIFSEPHILD